MRVGGIGVGIGSSLGTLHETMLTTGGISLFATKENRDALRFALPQNSRCSQLFMNWGFKRGKKQTITRRSLKTTCSLVGGSFYITEKRPRLTSHGRLCTIGQGAPRKYSTRGACPPSQKQRAGDLPLMRVRSVSRRAGMRQKR